MLIMLVGTTLSLLFWAIGELLEAPLRSMMGDRLRESLAGIASDPDLQPRF